MTTCSFFLALVFLTTLASDSVVLTGSGLVSISSAGSMVSEPSCFSGSVSNSRRRLKIGGAGELWVLAIATAFLTLGIYLANGGNITTKVSQNL